MSTARAQSPSPPPFRISATTELAAVAGKKTKDCFVGTHFKHRDEDFDNWLPGEQPEAGACTVVALVPGRNETLPDSIVSLLGIDESNNYHLLGARLKERGYLLTLPQVEELVEKAERGEATGMRTDSYDNFCFVGNGEGSAAVVKLTRLGKSDWKAYLLRLDRNIRCHTNNCLIVPNGVLLEAP